MAILRRIIGFLALGLFVVGEVHAFWVLRPMHDLDHALIVFGDDSLVPLQFRLASYRAGAGAFEDPGFLIPSAFGLILAIFWVMRMTARIVAAVNS